MRSIVAHSATKMAARAVMKGGGPRVLAASSLLIQSRSFAKLTGPGPDPLEVLRETCFKKNLCDEDGFRVPGVHWVFSVAINNENPSDPPNLRTIGMQCVTAAGIDFCVKQGRDFSLTPVSILYSQGKYVPGERAEQWRAEGYAEKIPLSYILEKIPHYTITGMIASNRIAMEQSKDSSEERILMKDKSHVTEIVQQTRMELENGNISPEEIESSITAYRFCPDRMERVHASPDSLLWERWEWMRSENGDCPEGTLAWEEPKWLLPH